MTDLQTRIAALSSEQRELLERRLAERVAKAPTDLDPITPRDRSLPTPLSIQQQREWAFAHFRGANNISGAFRVSGSFDLEVVGRALTLVTERHEVLRTTFEEAGRGQRVQVVHPVTPVPVPVEDISHLDATEQREEILRRWRTEMATPFPEAGRQRLRISILRLADSEHEVLITTEHSAGDMMSMAILIQEFAALYARETLGCAPLPPVQTQYGDFAAWQRRREADHVQAELEHWRRTLLDAPGSLAVPSDRPLPAAPTFAGGELLRELPEELAAGLQALADAEKASVGVLLCAASAALLYRYTGRDDLVIGEILAGRSRAEVEGTIGCFVGALPLRIRVRGDRSLQDLVRATREVVITAYAHQELPVDAMLDQLSLGADATVDSLMDLWIDVRTPPTRLEVTGLQIVPDPLDSVLASTPLTLGANPEAESLCLQWLYMAEMFDPATVELLADQFERILRGFVAAPSTRLDDLPLGIDGDEGDTSAQASTGAEPAGAPTTFLHGFAARVEQSPHAAAVVCDGVVTTYRELDRRAQRLAHRLLDLGVGPESRVGILLDRSPELLTAILGVMKSGGAYVPLDVVYPPSRSAGMLADASVLITHSRQEGYFEDAGYENPCPAVVLVDEQDGEDVEAPTPLPHADSLAYVVYTSGSTGRPKGAMIQHGSLATFAAEVRDRLGLGSGDRFLQFASPGFDVLAEEIFPIWLAGGAVVVPARSVTTGEDDLTDLLRRERVTVAELPTAFWHEWVRELDRREDGLPECLRMVIIGGERVLPDRILRWRRHPVPLVHCYGLTETTVTSTFYRLDPADPATEWPNLAIGTPIPSARLVVLDARLRPVPRGAVGELYIGGVSLARGYESQPSLTALRFVADPAGGGGRLYRTGDVVRRRPDGNLEFHARSDTQIKIRGYRIEPTEVEAVMSSFPGVDGTVVVHLEPNPGDRRLVGYVVAAEDARIDVADLRAHLQRELPPYMVPSALVELDALPLSPNGKVDRLSLPEPAEWGGSGQDDEPPQNEVQELLAGVVEDVLGVERVGIHDNFFEIGGDSILAIQLVARAADRGLKITPFDVFAKPTVAALSDVAATGPVLDAEQGEVAGPVPVSPAQRPWCMARMPEPQQWSLVADVELADPVDPDELRSGVEALVRHHDGLRSRVLVAEEATRVRLAAPGDATPVTVFDLSGLDEPAQDARIRELAVELQAGMDLAVGPLVQVALVGLGARPDRLLLVVHQLVADRSSLDLLLADLGSALTQVRDGVPVALPAKTTSWQSWVRRITRHAGSEGIQGQRGQWEDLLAAAPGDLPPDGPVPSGPLLAGAAEQVETTLAAEECTALTVLSESLGCERDDLVLAALGRVLSTWTGRPRTRVDVAREERAPIADEVDLTRTVGRFVVTHPFALGGDGAQDGGDRARAVHEARQGLPWPLVGYELLAQDGDPIQGLPADLLFVPEPPGAARSAAFAGPATVWDQVGATNRHSHPLTVRCVTTGDTVTVRWTHDPARHTSELVSRLAGDLLGELRALSAASGAAPTPADFPLANISQSQLDELLSGL